MNFYAYAGNDPLGATDPSGLSWTTFKNGLIEGGATGVFMGAAIAAIFAIIEAATEGTATAVIVPALAVIIGLKAAWDIAVEIKALILDDMCPDERHYRIGFLIGSVIGAIAGGAAVNGLGGAGEGENTVEPDDPATDLHRPYIRKAVRQTVEDAAPRTPDGRPIDPNTRQPIDGTPDFGHKPGNEFWREKAQAEREGLTQKEFNDRMNDPSKYQLEDPSSNRSHQYEKKP